MNDPEVVAHQFLYECEHLRGLSRSTVTNYKTLLNHFQAHVRLRDISDVTPDTIRSYLLYGRAKCGWKAITVHTYVKLLVVYFKWCVKRQFIEKTPMVDIELPILEDAVPRDIPADEAARLLEAAYNYPNISTFSRYRNHAIFSMLIFAGLRKTELINLKLMDVDFEVMTIFVRQGKGRKDRKIPMDFTLAMSLRRYIRERDRHNKTAPEFFTAYRKNTGMTEYGLLYVVDCVRDASGIRFSLHQLRHTFATQMLIGGCSLPALKAMMGHSKIETTERYTRGVVNHLRAEIEKHPMGKCYKS